MKRLVIGLFLASVPLAASVALDATPAGACSCTMSTDRDAFARSDAVFVGEVAGYEAPPTAEGFASTDPARWTFTVTRVYRGAVAATQTVVSEVSGASCGLEIPKRGEFLVFAEARGTLRSPEPGRGELYAGLCGGTRAISDGAPDPALGIGHEPGPASEARANAEPISDVVDDGSGGWPVVPIAGAALVASVVGLRLARRARRRRGSAPLG